MVEGSGREQERKSELFHRYPGLEASVPWLPLGDFPTPVQRLESLGKRVGAAEFYVKRDDLSSSHYGGNKVRKLEFLLADARSKSATTLVTFGGAGSNHVLATAIHGNRMGMRTAAVLIPQPNAEYVRKNLLLDLAYGVYLVPTRSTAGAAWGLLKGVARWFELSTLRTPYLIMPGGSSRVGCLGFVEAALELASQVKEGLLPEPEFIFVAYGSGGTAAGLHVGLRLAGLSSKVIPFAVADRFICNRYILAMLINRLSRRLAGEIPGFDYRRIGPGEIPLEEGYLGDEYARFTPEGLEAVKIMRETEGLILEGTYTGKALAGALDFIRAHGLEKRPCLFWNTYNSVDLSAVAEAQDWRSLPPMLSRYFIEPTQEDLLGPE